MNKLNNLLQKMNKNNVLIILTILLILIIILIFNIFFKNGVSSTKRVDGLVITNTSIDYNGTISVLTAKVKNNSKEKKEDIKLKIIFFDKSKKEITSTTGYVGDIEVKKTVELSAAISMELKNISSVKYEILK